MFMASRKQTLEREHQTYTVRPLSISTTTKPKLSYQVLGEHHKDRAEERAARSDAKVRQIFSDNCSCCNPSPFHNYCQHPAPSGQQCNALTQHRLLRCNSLNIFRLPCWSPSWEGWTRPWKVFRIKVSQLPCNNLRIAKNGKPNFAGDENGKREEDLEEEIKDVKERFRNAEVIICSHLGTIWLLSIFKILGQCRDGWADSTETSDRNWQDGGITSNISTKISNQLILNSFLFVCGRPSKLSKRMTSFPFPIFFFLSEICFPLTDCIAGWEDEEDPYGGGHGAPCSEHRRHLRSFDVSLLLLRHGGHLEV